MTREKLIIGQGADYDIVWDDDFPLIEKIVSLVDHAKSAGVIISKHDLQGIIDPDFKHCLARLDASISDVSELIEFFTFSDVTIFHNSKMHASIYQNITIMKTNETEFVSYLTSVYDALVNLMKRQSETDSVALVT